MFGFLGPKCPIDVRGKTWTELRFCWLTERLGIERMLRSEVMLPTEAFFPDEFDGSDDSVHRVMNRVCHQLQIDPARVQLEIFEERGVHQTADLFENQRVSGAAGVYETTEDEAARISVARSQLDDFESLIATLAHELAHHILLGGNLLRSDHADHEYITDLLLAFLGLGVFAANSTIREGHVSTGGIHAWQVRSQGYLSARDYGYALALFAWVRQEVSPDWRLYLRLDARESFEEGLHYLERTEDSFFQRYSRTNFATQPVSELLFGLREKHEATRLAVLWELQARGVAGEDEIEAVLQTLKDKNPIIRSEAAIALGEVRNAEFDVSPLLAALGDADDEVRAATARALGNLRSNPERVIPSLALLVSDNSRQVVVQAISSLAQFELHASCAVPQILRILHAALVDCDYQISRVAIYTVCVATEDALAHLRGHLEDEDLLGQALELYEELAVEPAD